MNLNKNRVTTWTISILTLVITSCAGIKNAQLTSQLDKSNCNQQVARTYTKDELPNPIHTLDLDTLLTNRFSSQSLNAANAVELLDLLTEYVNLKKDFNVSPTLEKRIEIVELSQRINQRINISSLEVSAVASEMDCEEERADQIATYLKGKEDDAETKLTVGAIVVGAAGAITSGILLANGVNGNAHELIGLGAGLTEATLGILILMNKRKVTFYHPRNALKDIWTAPDTSTIFPSSVWYYLTYENPNTKEKSLRQQLLDKWLGFGQIADTKEKNKEKIYDLFFGEGGKYSADQLTNRANMHDQIEAHINLMKQDLKLLALELEKLNNE
ncbi:hypothetical protein ACFOUP_18390 [Belliella kenyensis]|uniref:Lipoprotein n=1 Tax=Belliella kenyensis TaxID=1472724 RepID=A0ABV8EPU1_9BACT|nr:hypothetical protein [Belliella kenyensis]MCH7402253.1 hypothetical protein [Belliella kenyensis]MDN3601767.1 hypothetical protein [Belliella kenyensis]